MSEVRFGVVGYGNIGRTHVDTLRAGEVPRGCVTAVVANDEVELPEDVARHASLEEMLTSDQVDAVIVATPTMSHPDLGHAVLRAQRHLVMEKPVAMSAGQAQALVQAVPAGVCAAAMLNQRYHPVYARIKQIVERGDLGTVTRFNWIMTAWYRPDVYFLVSRWRGTWPGEGGGALLNQCIHNLDVLQWVLGLPESVVADARFGKYHGIEVEDEVTAMLSYADGLTGVLVASTGEAPGMNKLDIVGDRGTLQFDGETLLLSSTPQSVAEHCATTKEMFGMPSFDQEVIEIEANGNQHACVLQNFVDAVLDGETLQTPLAEGLGSLELANAMLLSAWQDRRVHLPLDHDAYENVLAQRINASALRDAQAIDVQIDMEASYR